MVRYGHGRGNYKFFGALRSWSRELQNIFGGNICRESVNLYNGSGCFTDLQSLSDIAPKYCSLIGQKCKFVKCTYS